MYRITKIFTTDKGTNTKNITISEYGYYTNNLPSSFTLISTSFCSSYTNLLFYSDEFKISCLVSIEKIIK